MKSVPHIKGDFLLGSMRRFKSDSLQTMIAWQREYGDIVSFNLGPQRLYLLSHPIFAEHALVQQADVFVKMYQADKPKGLALILGQGLVTSQGDLWRRQRRLIQPILHRNNLSKMLPQMQAAGEAMLQRWRQLGENACVDIGQEMMQLALEVITQTMFSTSVLSEVEQIAAALETSLYYAVKSIRNPFTFPLSIPTPANQAFKQARNFLDTLVYGLIQQHQANPNHYQDLLSMLLAATDESSGEKMSVRQIRDEVLTVFTAGHETTATALTWTLYLLTKHPFVLTKIQQEFAQVLNGKPADEDSLANLMYLRAVLDEALRIRPPAGMLMRHILKDTEIDGYPLKAGSLAIINIYNIHHHPDFWPQPDVFDPERFLGTEKRKFVYLPFGIGQRVCIGNHFALYESRLLLSLILQRYQLELLDPSEVEMAMAVTIRPKQKIFMRLHAY